MSHAVNKDVHFTKTADKQKHLALTCLHYFFLYELHPDDCWTL